MNNQIILIKSLKIGNLGLRYVFFSKICIIEAYLLKYYIESHLIYKWR